jgi:hypothetical protein
MSLKTDIYNSEIQCEKFYKKINLINIKEKRVRQPVTRSKGRVVGYFPSVKSNRSVAWESQMELKACRLFEYCPTVRNYREQPEIVHYKLNGMDKKYIPDFELIRINDERVLIEIKPKAVLAKIEEKVRFTAISNKLAETNTAFAAMTEDELNVKSVQDNIKLIHPFSTLDSNQELKSYLKDLCSKKDITIGFLVEIGLSLKTIYSSIAKGYLNIELTQKVTLHSKVFIKEEKDHENSIFTCRFAPNFK